MVEYYAVSAVLLYIENLPASRLKRVAETHITLRTHAVSSCHFSARIEKSMDPRQVVHAHADIILS